MPNKRENKKKRVLFFGQCYYNNWYLSRELRKLGWKADVVNFDINEENNRIFYHGEDFKFEYKNLFDVLYHIYFYFRAIFSYDIFHFTGVNGIGFFWEFHWLAKKLKIDRLFPQRLDVRILRALGKKIVYTNNGSNDGILRKSYADLGLEPWECDILGVTNDLANTNWAKLRNSLADYQCILGGMHCDFNKDKRVHEAPEIYCLDKDFWNPNLLIPTNFRLNYPRGYVKIFHSVGNFESRTSSGNRNIKSTHIYLPLIEKLKIEGYKVKLIFFCDVPNKNLRFYQAQADIVVDMLTFGFFGANIREAMMLGKPAVCYLRKEWLDNMRKEIPDYVKELPIINATPSTIHKVLVDLIANPKKRETIGEKSREFALKWHSSETAAKKFDKIYSSLLKGRAKL